MEPIRKIAKVVRTELPNARVLLSDRMVLEKGMQPVYAGVRVIIPGMSRSKTSAAVHRALKNRNYFRTRSQESVDPRSVFVTKEQDEGVSVHLPLESEKMIVEDMVGASLEKKIALRAANRVAKRKKIMFAARRSLER